MPYNLWLYEKETTKEFIMETEKSITHEDCVDSLKQLKSEILPLLNDALEEFSDNKFEHGRYYLEQAIVKLSDEAKNSSYRHPKCMGYMTRDTGDGSEFECGYGTTITCEHCRYGGGRKDPEAKCNQNR